MRDQGIYTRHVDKLASTEFTFTRFFVPYMNDFKGWAVFCDCDFLWKIPAKNLENIVIPVKQLLCTTRLHTKRNNQDGRTEYKQSTQEKIGAVWCFGIVNILRIKY